MREEKKDCKVLLYHFHDAPVDSTQIVLKYTALSNGNDFDYVTIIFSDGYGYKDNTSTYGYQSSYVISETGCKNKEEFLEKFPEYCI